MWWWWLFLSAPFVSLYPVVCLIHTHTVNFLRDYLLPGEVMYVWPPVVSITRASTLSGHPWKLRLPSFYLRPSNKAPAYYSCGIFCVWKKPLIIIIILSSRMSHLTVAHVSCDWRSCVNNATPSVVTELQLYWCYLTALWLLIFKQKSYIRLQTQIHP